jgi:hypothetical protein
MGAVMCSAARDVRAHAHSGSVIVNWDHPEEKGRFGGRARAYRITAVRDRYSNSAYQRAYTAALLFAVQDPSRCAEIAALCVSEGGDPQQIVNGIVAAAPAGLAPAPGPMLGAIHAGIVEAVALALADGVAGAAVGVALPPSWSQQPVDTATVDHVRGQRYFSHRLNRLRNGVQYKFSVQVLTVDGDGPTAAAVLCIPERTPGTSPLAANGAAH